MNEIVADSYTSVVEILFTVVYLAAIAYTLTLVTNAMWTYEDRQASIERIEEYRKYNQYDNTKVYQQDIVGLILETRGEYTVSVKSDKGTYSWSLSSVPCTYSAEAISNIIDDTRLFTSVIRKDDNGGIVGYEFIEEPGGGGPI